MKGNLDLTNSQLFDNVATLQIESFNLKLQPTTIHCGLTVPAQRRLRS